LISLCISLEQVFTGATPMVFQEGQRETMIQVWSQNVFCRLHLNQRSMSMIDHHKSVWTSTVEGREAEKSLHRNYMEQFVPELYSPDPLMSAFPLWSKSTV